MSRHLCGAISAYETGGQVIVEVSDDGPGVAPAQLPHIFERFYRARPGSARPGSARPGSGPAPASPALGTLASATPTSPRGLRITLSIPVDGRPDDAPQPHPPNAS